MFMIPIETVDHVEDAVVVILDPGTVERMKVGDPAEAVLRDAPTNLVNPTILICLEEPGPEFDRVMASGDLKKVLEYLRRGFQFRPDLGDHDRGPESVAKLS